jgi:hypothetical protein
VYRLIVSHFQNRKSNNCRLYVKCNVWKFTRTVYGTALQIYRNSCIFFCAKVVSFFLVLKKQRNTLRLGRIRLNNYGSRWKAEMKDLVFFYKALLYERCNGLARDPHGKLGLRTGQSQGDVCM